MRDLKTAKFRRRYLVAMAASLLLHAIALVYVFRTLDNYEPERERPIVLTWHNAPAPEPAPEPPPPPPGPKSVVDAVNPTNEPVAPTDLIAEQNSRAANPTPAEGADNAPRVNKVGEFDDAGAVKQKPVPPAVKPSPPKEKKKDAPKKTKEPDKADARVPRVAPERAPDLQEPGDGAGKDVSEEPALPQPVQVARAGGQLPQLPASDLRSRDARGRLSGGVKNLGFLGFEAMQDQMAPYLKQIRKRVERNWYAALELKYSGATPTRAVVDCMIGPDGKLVDVVIVEPGNSATYGALCRDAIQRAAPFPPFPFKVPDIYAEKNLEIRWTFGFLM